MTLSCVNVAEEEEKKRGKKKQTLLESNPAFEKSPILERATRLARRSKKTFISLNGFIPITMRVTKMQGIASPIRAINHGPDLHVIYKMMVLIYKDLQIALLHDYLSLSNLIGQ